MILLMFLVSFMGNENKECVKYMYLIKDVLEKRNRFYNPSNLRRNININRSSSICFTIVSHYI